MNPPPFDSARFEQDASTAVSWLRRYFDSLEQYPVLARSRPGDVRRALPAAPPQQPEPFDAVLADIDSVLMPAMTHWNAPGFMAYFASTSSAPGIIGELLAAGLNVNAMLWRTAPASTELEQVVTDWLRQMVGLPSPLLGVINDTASSSTLYALAAARHALQLDIDTAGIAGRDLPQLVCYASQEAHSSVAKALMVLGLGRDSLRTISVDEAYRMRPDALQQAIADDVRAGRRPMAVVATAGTTSATSVDPVAAIATVCERAGVWLHVDAAYGGIAAIDSEHRWVLDGAERADSIVVNPHKWLFTPIDCSVLWTRRPEAFRGAFSLTPAYLETAESDDTEALNLMDFGAAMGRRFRSLKLWMVIRHFGVRGLASMIHDHCAMAQELAQRVRDSDEFELMAPVPLSVVCLRARGIDPAMNRQIIDRINADGRIFLSHTVLDGQLVIRVAFGNLRATHTHADQVWSALRSARSELLQATR